MVLIFRTLMKSGFKQRAEQLSLWDCDQITMEFVEQAIEALRNRKDPPAKPVLLHLNVKLITASILDNPEIVSAPSLLRIFLRPYCDNDDQDNYIQDAKYDDVEYFEIHENNEMQHNDFPYVYKIWPYYLKSAYWVFHVDRTDSDFFEQ